MNKSSASKRMVWGGVLGVLGIAIGLVVVAGILHNGDWVEREKAVDLSIFNNFKKAIEKLGGTPLPLGETELVSERTQEILRYDSVGYWRVSTKLGNMMIYVGYWGPGKQTIREIAFHTPNHCWVADGWHKDSLSVGDMISGDRAASTAKQGCFTYGQGGNTYVAFWHVFDKQVVDYGDSMVPSRWSIITSLWRVKFNQRKAQWFVRIHAEVPLRSLQDTEVMKATLHFMDEIAPGEPILRVN